MIHKYRYFYFETLPIYRYIKTSIIFFFREYLQDFRCLTWSSCANHVTTVIYNFENTAMIIINGIKYLKVEKYHTLWAKFQRKKKLLQFVLHSSKLVSFWLGADINRTNSQGEEEWRNGSFIKINTDPKVSGAAQFPGGPCSVLELV